MTITTDAPFTPGQLTSLRSACQGAVSVLGEDPYQEEVATWNLAVRLRPALAVGARTTDDVVAAVGWAARLGLAVGVNATGHGAVPNADGALLINTRRLSRITIDPGHAIATVGAGSGWVTSPRPPLVTVSRPSRARPDRPEPPDSPSAVALAS